MKTKKQLSRMSVANWIGISVLVLGVSVLVGWLLDIELLIRVLPQLSAMNPSTAVLFVALALSFLLVGWENHQKSGIFLGIARTLLAAVVLFATLRVVDIALGDIMRIDSLLFSNEIAQATAPARMSLSTATNFFLLGVSIFLALSGNRLLAFFGQLGAIATLSISGLALFLYSWKSVIFLENPFYFSMALHTAAAFFLLAIAVTLCLRERCSTRLHLFNFKFLSGIFLLFAFTWYFLIAPEITKLPKNFSYLAGITSSENLYDSKADTYAPEQVFHGNLSYRTVNSTRKLRQIVGTLVFSESGETTERRYGVNAYTLQHVVGYGDRDRDGFLFAPKYLNKEEFTYWPIGSDAPVSMKFEGEEDVSGLIVYRYSSHYISDETANFPVVSEEYPGSGIESDAYLQVWVEPETGWLVKYEDTAVSYVYNQETGERMHPWSKWNREFTPISISEQTTLARRYAQQQLVVERIIPFIFFAIAVVIIFVGIAFRYQKRIFVYILPAFVLLSGFGGTFFMWEYAKSNVYWQISTEFARESDSLRNLILERLEIYANALKSGRGLLLSSDAVKRDEWKTFVEGIDIQRNYPGVQGIGFAQVLNPDEVSSFEESVRAEGFPEFKVFPDTPRSIYTSIKYLEPFDFRNQRAFGYDMFSQEVRRMAMEYARDNDETAISGKVLLLQETDDDVQAGFLMYVPLYAKGSAIDTVEKRREAISGYVYSPFRMGDFVNSAVSRQSYGIAIDIFDGQSAEEDNKMYGDSPAVDQSSDLDRENRFVSTQTVELYGHLWTFQFVSLPGYGLGDFQEAYPSLVLRLGIILSILLAGITYSLSSSRARAVNLAEEITEDLRDRTRALEEVKKRDEAILAGIGEGLAATDERGRIIMTNRAFSDILGWSGVEAAGKHMVDFVPMETESGERVLPQDRPLSKVLNAGKVVIDPDKYYVRKDGSRVSVELNVAPVESEGRSIGVIEIFRDISKEKEVDRMKTEFLSLASHQLRTPLAAMKWFLEILMDGTSGKLKDNQRDIVERVNRSNNNMIELVNSLLNVSRLEQGRIMVDPSPTDLKQLLQEVLGELTVSFQSKKQEIVNHFDATTLVINVDAKLIRQIYLNLVSNAVKYSPLGSKIEISLTKMSGDVVFSVKDSGYGIPKDEHDRIFTKFYRASNIATKETDGNGLGLYLVKKIVEVSGGRIWFESEENKGTTFSFSLPLSGSKKREGVKTLT
ncbi:MAG: CHASE domain-containing protein [Candidatus Moraniibacteriota bacterium]|nr:MAG: CHASE domain-containing protein [Candidatus Moranbacteria bacterium]